MNFEAIASVVIITGWACLFGYVLTGLREEEEMSNPPVPSPRGEGRCRRLLTTARNLGAQFMSVLDDALARFTSFVTSVVAQLKAAGETNGTQTGKLAELQSALDTALADDNADKAAIAALQDEVNTLQDSVAAQINAAIDSLQNPPADVVAPDPVAVNAPVVDVPVAEDTTTPVDQTGDTPVE